MARRLALYLAIGGLMVVLDTTVTVVALPRLVEVFSTSVAATTWVTTACALALVTTMPTAAWAAERFGPRRTYLFALSLFTAGSVAAGLAWSLPALVIFRALQGLGGGLINPVGMAIVLAAAPEDRRGRMMSLLGLPILVGPVIAPIIGGALVDHLSWRWIFFINVPIGLLAIAAGRRLLPPNRSAGSAVGRPDLRGLLLLCPGLALLVLGLSNTGGGGDVGNLQVVLPLLAGGSAVALFARRAWRAPQPLLRIRVLTKPGMAASGVTLALFSAAYFGSALIGPAYVQLVRGDSATLSGAVGIPQALGTGFALQIATRLVDRIAPRTVIRAGIGIALLATIARVLVLTPTTPYWLIAALGGVAGLGIGATLMPTLTAGTRALHGTEISAGSTVLNVISQTSAALGTAFAAAVLSSLIALGLPTAGGTFSSASNLSSAARAVDTAMLTDAIRITLAALAVLMALAWLATRRLPTALPSHLPIATTPPASGSTPFHRSGGGTE